MSKIICYKGEPSECRAYQLHSGDEIYMNVAAVKTLGYGYELKLSENIFISGMQAMVVKRYTHKKYPNKKWWQFWLKQEEYIDGYNLMVL